MWLQLLKHVIKAEVLRTAEEALKIDVTTEDIMLYCI